MPSTSITNSLTRQGGSSDVSSFFDVDGLMGQSLSSEQLRGITGASWLCQKVVSHIARELVNVEFGLTVTGSSAKSRAMGDLTMIQEQLRRLMPWFGEAQVEANIVGTSYLVIQARGFRDPTVPTEDPAAVIEDPPEQSEDQEGMDSEIQFQEEHNHQPNAPMPSTRPRRGRRKNQEFYTAAYSFDTTASAEDWGVSLEDLMARFPHTFPIDWDNFDDMQVVGVEIVGADQYTWSHDRRFLYRDESKAKGEHDHRSGRSRRESENIKIRETLSKWFDADPDGDTNQLEIINRANVIEFQAFDYQAPPKKRPSKYSVDGKAGSCGGCGNSDRPTFRLTRFISSLLYFDSFVNSAINRAHRSEFLVYKKEDLGSSTLELARLSASTEYSHPAIAAPVIDAEQAVLKELNTIANSAVNLGVVMVDKSSDVNMVSRSFTGIQNLFEIFRTLVIGASGLTEFTLLGMTFGGTGLNGFDVRDRMSIASQVDIHFRDGWQPRLEELANMLSSSYRDLPRNSYLSIKASSSFKLTELEVADVLDKVINTRLSLIDKDVLTREELRAELKGDGLLGKYFVITEPDAATKKEIEENRKMSASYAEQVSTSTNSATTPATTTKQQASTDKTAAKLNVKVKPKTTEKNA